MALIHEWRSEDIAATDGETVNLWTPSFGAKTFVSFGGGDPSYKTAITPTGKPVLRFDGHVLVTSGIANARHVFIIAAWRGEFPAGSPNLGLFGASDASSGALPTWWRDVATTPNFTDGGANFNLFRDGVDTNEWYINGRFALYEGVQLAASESKNPTLGAWAGRGGQWDVCYLRIHDAEVTGEELANLRAALGEAYFVLPPGDGLFNNQVFDIRLAADRILQTIQARFDIGAQFIGQPNLPPIAVYHRSAAGRLETITPCLMITTKETFETQGDHLNGRVQFAFELIIDGPDTDGLVTNAGQYVVIINEILSNLPKDIFAGGSMGGQAGRHHAFWLESLQTFYDEIAGHKRIADAFAQIIRIEATFQLRASPVL